MLVSQSLASLYSIPPPLFSPHFGMSWGDTAALAEILHSITGQGRRGTVVLHPVHIGRASARVGIRGRDMSHLEMRPLKTNKSKSKGKSKGNTIPIPNDKHKHRYP